MNNTIIHNYIIFFISLYIINMSNLNNLEKNYVINYLKNTHWYNSPWAVFSDKAGRVFPAIWDSTKVNFDTNIVKSDDCTYCRFRGWKTEDDDYGLKVQRLDLNNIKGYNYNNINSVQPNTGNKDSVAEYDNFISANDREIFNSEQLHKRYPLDLNNGVVRPNYIPGYDRISRTTGTSSDKTHQFLRIVKNGLDNWSPAFVLYKKKPNLDQYANDIYENHPKLVNIIINDYYNNCNNKSLQQLCLDDGNSTGSGTTFVNLSNCNMDNINQVFTYESNTGLIRNRKKPNLCIDDGGGLTAGSTELRLVSCDANNINQQFDYNQDTKLIKNRTKNLCIDDKGASNAGEKIWTHICDPNNKNQQFEIDNITGLIRSTNKFNDILCKEHCLLSANQSKCKDTLKTFCNHSNNVNTPICKTWCQKTENKAECDQAAITYCKKNLNDDIFCGCFEENARHQIPDELETVLYGGQTGSNNKAYCWQKYCADQGYKTYTFRKNITKYINMSKMLSNKCI